MRGNSLKAELDYYFEELCYLNKLANDKEGSGNKKRKLDIEILPEKLREPEQISFILIRLIDLDKLPSFLMRHLKTEYAEVIETNPDVGHRWCELVVKNRFKACYGDIRYFLTQHQGMGVYLYAEMAMSRNKTLVKLANDIFIDLKHELDRNTYAVVKNIIKQ